MIGRRLLTAAVGLPFLLAALWVGGAVWALGVTALALAAVRELVQLGASGRVRPAEAMAASALVCLGGGVAGLWPALWPLWLVAPSAAFAGGLVLFLTADGARGPAEFLGAAGTGVYPTFGFTFLMALRWGAHGFLRTVSALALVWLGDVAAYAVGSLVGGPRLLPQISPGKTWAGAVAALLASGATGWAVHGWLGLAPGAGALLGLGASVLAQFGDLAESLLKRRAGVKDSGDLLPGHGGILDRFDGLITALPLVWLVVRGLHG